MTKVTHILDQIEDGDPTAADQLLPLVYDELRRLASRILAGEKPGQTLQATALVHEAYLRLVGKNQDPHWDNRRHFFIAAAEAMRRILVDNARRKKAAKHGGQFKREELHDQIEVPGQSIDLIALDEALNKLTVQHARKAELVKLRYFAGMTICQAAEVLQIAESTADADWAYAKSWLRLKMAE